MSTPETQVAATWIAAQVERIDDGQRQAMQAALLAALDVMPWHGEPLMDGRAIVMNGDRPVLLPIRTFALHGAWRSGIASYAARQAGISVRNMPYDLHVDIRPGSVRAYSNGGDWQELYRSEPPQELPPVTAATEWHAANLALAQLRVR
jgi:hypothetical protein